MKPNVTRTGKKRRSLSAEGLRQTVRKTPDPTRMGISQRRIPELLEILDEEELAILCMS
jgi:hypothetical protein